MDKLGEVNRLHHVCVDAQLVALREVSFLAGGGEHHDGDQLQLCIPLDLSQYLDSIHTGHLDVQQHKRGILPGAHAVGALEGQVVQHCLPVVYDVHFIDEVALLKSRQRQLYVLRVVLGVQDPFQTAHTAIPFSGNEKENVLPLPGSLSAHVPPPCRLTIRLTLANPIPVPSNSDVLCSLWKTPKSLSAPRGSKPTPLSRIWITTASSCLAHRTSITACSLGRVYLSALSRRFVIASFSRFLSPWTWGRSPTTHLTSRPEAS